MDTVYTIPTPKTPIKTPDLTRDQRLRIQTLFFDAGWKRDDICLQTGATPRQVQYALANRLTPQKNRSGRKPILSTPQRKRLVNWITQNKSTRRADLLEIPEIFGWDCGEKSIREALRREGYVRRVAKRKTPFTPELCAKRLAWAEEHLNWTQEQWDSILWSDETWVQPGSHAQEWIIRKIGSEELYHPDCLKERHQRKIGWMFWGCISGKYGKGMGIFWEKEWKTITKESYSEHIIPAVASYLQAYPGLQFQQDNAPGHGAAFTIQTFRSYGVEPIDWPPYSPDMSPIETLWDWMKDWIQENRPGVHKNYRRLREAVIAAWNAIEPKRIKELLSVRALKARCQALIDAQGGPTKY